MPELDLLCPDLKGVFRGIHEYAMDLFKLSFTRIIGWFGQIAKYVDRPEVIFALMMAALLISLGSLMERR